MQPRIMLLAFTSDDARTQRAGVRTAAHDVAVVYDASGRKYGRGTGLMLLVDGVVMARSPTLAKISATISDGPLALPLPKPPSPRPPPPPPVAGWTQLTNYTGTFCCDGLSSCQPPLLKDTTEAECFAKAIQAGADWATVVQIPTKPPGCFIAKSCAKQGGYRDTPSPSYIRTWTRAKPLLKTDDRGPKPSLMRRRFGVNVHRHDHGDAIVPARRMLQICAAAAVNRNDAWWRHIEISKGNYNFSNTDRWVAAVNRTTGGGCAAGATEPMLVHWILEGGNALYTGKDATPPTTAAAVAAFTRFAVAMMSRYAGRGFLWEICENLAPHVLLGSHLLHSDAADSLLPPADNEADIRSWSIEQYAALVISVGKAVRADPAIAAEAIVGPSTSTVCNCAKTVTGQTHCGWISSLKELGALQYVDAVAVHAYCAGAPEQMRWQFAAMRKFVGNATAVISGEWGWVMEYSPPCFRPCSPPC